MLTITALLVTGPLVGLDLLYESVTCVTAVSKRIGVVSATRAKHQHEYFVISDCLGECASKR